MAKKIIIEDVELGNSGEVSKDKINNNFDKVGSTLDILDGETVKKVDTTTQLGFSAKRVPTEYAVSQEVKRLKSELDKKPNKDEVAIGTILKGEKDNVAQIKAIANPQKGDTYKAKDTGHYWTFDGSQWNDVGEILPNNAATLEELGLQWGSVISGDEFNLNIPERKIYIRGQIIVQWGEKFSNTLNVNEVVDYENGLEDDRYQGLNAIFYDRLLNRFRFLRYTAFSEVTTDYLIIATLGDFNLVATNSRMQINGELVTLISSLERIKKLEESSVSGLDTKTNIVPSATCNIKIADILTPLSNAVFNDVVDTNGLKWYRLTFSSGIVNNNTGYLGKTTANLLKLGAYATTDINDINGFHAGDKIYFKIRFKSNRNITVVTQYNNLTTGAYIARASQDTNTGNSNGEDTIIYLQKTINDLPANYDKVGISVCFQRPAYEANDDYFEFREVIINKTPFTKEAIITSKFDDEFYNKESSNENTNVDLQPVVDRGNDGVQRPIADINLLLAYGQSNSTGQQTAPPLSRNNYKGNLMQGNHEWVHYGNTNTDQLNLMYARPAISYGKTSEEAEQTTIDDQMPCESPNIAFCNASKSMLDKALLGLADRKFLGITAGFGGCSIEILSKNVPNTNGAKYNSLLQAITKAKASADTLAKSIVCSAVTWIQGEYNTSQSNGQGWEAGTNASNDKELYKTRLKQLATDLIADTKNVFNQEDAPLILITQHGTGWLREFELYIQMALLEASSEDSRLVMACPLYQVTNRGHLDPNGARWIGEYFSKVYNKVVLKGESWKPLQPKKITKGLKTIILDYHVPTPPLKFDNHTVKPIENYGFRIRENGAYNPISSVSIISPTQIKIECVNSFTSDVEIGYASHGLYYGNVCDSDTYLALNNYVELPEQLKPTVGTAGNWSKYEPKDSKGNVIYNKPYPLQNFSVQFYYKINKEVTEINI